jgi:hypothetical protein
MLKKILNLGKHFLSKRKTKKYILQILEKAAKKLSPSWPKKKSAKTGVTPKKISRKKLNP